MERYCYKLAGIFADQASADPPRQRLPAGELRADQLRWIGPCDRTVDCKLEPGTDAARQRLVVDVLVAAGMGALAGLVTDAIVAWLLPGLFAADPWVVALALIACGVHFGAVVGAVPGSRFRGTRIAAQAKERFERDANAVLVHARDRGERQWARTEVMTTGELVDFVLRIQ